jgi:hypothetical protein
MIAPIGCRSLTNARLRLAGTKTRRKSSMRLSGASRKHAAELVAADERGPGPAGVPVVAVGDDEHVVGAPGTARVGQLPRRVRPLPGVLHRGLEADAVAEAEVVDVAVDVGGDVGVVREVGIALRHREVRVLHPVARPIDV